MRCRNCGEELEQGARFCPQCGEKTEVHCPVCGEVVEETVKFCPFCGGVVSKVKNETEQNAVNIVVQEAGENKVKVIEIVRRVTGWGLKESKDAVDGVEQGIELVIHHIPQEKAENIVNELSQNGATAELVRCDIAQEMEASGEEIIRTEGKLSESKIEKDDLSDKQYSENQKNYSGKSVIDKIQQVKKSAKDILDEEDHLTEITDDQYRNKLAGQAKKYNAGVIISGLIIIKTIWDYHIFFTLKDGIIVFFIIGIVIGFVEEMIGCDKYFGERRVKRYDKIKESSSQREAMTVMENNKGGTIRAILTLLIFTVGTMLISDFCCKQYVNFVIEKRMDEVLDNMSFSTNEEMTDTVEKLQEFTTVEKSDNRYSFNHNGKWILVIDAENEFINFKDEEVVMCIELFMGEEILYDSGASAGGFYYDLDENIIRMYCDAEVEEGRLYWLEYDIDKKEFTFRIGKDDYYPSDEFVEWVNDFELVAIMEADIKRFEDELEENGIRTENIYKLKYKNVDKIMN